MARRRAVTYLEGRMVLTLTNEEANALVTLLDLAVKSGGIRVASAAGVIMQKLEEAAKNAGQKEFN